MSQGYDLIEELINNTESFHKQGLGNELLNAYYKGLPINTIKPLLKNGNELILKEILYILSELSSTECNFFLNDIISLLNYEDYTIKYYAMQCIFSGTFDSEFEKFIHIIKQTESSDVSVINYVFELISHANINQLNRSLEELRKFSFINSISHQKGLSFFINNQIIDDEKIIEFLKYDKILQGYGVLLIMRKYKGNYNSFNYSLNDENFIYDELLSAIG